MSLVMNVQRCLAGLKTTISTLDAQTLEGWVALLFLPFLFHLMSYCQLQKSKYSMICYSDLNSLICFAKWKRIAAVAPQILYCSKLSSKIARVSPLKTIVTRS